MEICFWLTTTRQGQRQMKNWGQSGWIDSGHWTCSCSSSSTTMMMIITIINFVSICFVPLEKKSDTNKKKDKDAKIIQLNLWDDHFFPEKKFDVFVVAQDKDQKDEEK